MQLTTTDSDMILRIARASDADALRGLLSRLSPATVQARYMSAWTSLTGARADSELERMLDSTEPRRVVVLAEIAARIVGVGEFFVEAPGHAAELALLVEDAFQGRGIGKCMYRRLVQLARERGVATFTGDVLPSNHRVRHLLRKNGRALRVQFAYGTERFTLQLGNLNPSNGF